MSKTKDPLLTIVLSFYGLLIFIVVCVLALVFATSTAMGQNCTTKGTNGWHQTGVWNANGKCVVNGKEYEPEPPLTIDNDAQPTCPLDKMKNCVIFTHPAVGDGAWYDPEYTSQGGSILHDANPNEGVEPTYERVYLTEDLPHCKPGRHLMQYINGVDLETNTQPHYQFNTYSHFVDATAPNPNTRAPGYRCIADGPKSEGAIHRDGWIDLPPVQYPQPQPQDVIGTFEGSPVDGMFVGSSQKEPIGDTFPPSSTAATSSEGFAVSFMVADKTGKRLVTCDAEKMQNPIHCVLGKGVTLDDVVRQSFDVSEDDRTTYNLLLAGCKDREAKYLKTATQCVAGVHKATRILKKAGAY